MTAIDRTAYPRPGARLTREELAVRYHLTETDRAFIDAHARGDTGRLMLATLLKTRRDLGCFPALDEVHAGTVAYLAAQLGVAAPQAWADGVRRTKSLYRYQAAVRAHLSLTPYDDAAERLVAGTVLEAAETMSDPADLINRAVEALQAAAIDLPAFSTLDRLVNRLRAEVHGRMYDRVAARLAAEHAAVLDALLAKPPDSPTTGFNRLKQAPGPATPKTVRLWTDRLDWLGGLIDPDPLLEGIAHTKLRQFAAEAAALEVGDLLDIAQPGKRHTLLLALLRQARMRCRDELIEMMLRRIRRTQAAAKEQLDALHDQHRAIEETLIGIFGQVLETAQAQDSDAAFGRQVRTLLAEQGGVETLAGQCGTVSAWHRGNDLPLLWPIHAKHRVLLFRLLDLMDIRSATQDRSLLDALAVVSRHRHARRDEVLGDVDLGFASQRWQGFVAKRRSGPGTFDRRALEVCVFVHLADALQTGDLYVVGAETFADYRAQLLPWAECAGTAASLLRRPRHPRAGRGLRGRAEGRADDARRRGRCRLPGQYRAQPRCRRNTAPEATGDDGRSPPGWPTSSRKSAPACRSATFSTSSNMPSTGPATPVTSGHPPAPIRSSRRPSSATCSPCSATAATSAQARPPGTPPRSPPRRRCAGSTRSTSTPASSKPRWSTSSAQYARFSLPRHWGSGRAAIADGTHVKLRENNLLGSRHIRYGGYGGIAYHHIADSYIALFTSFIPCGVWEAVHILDGLLKNRSAIQPDTLHADTQGQSSRSSACAGSWASS